MHSRYMSVGRPCPCNYVNIKPKTVVAKVALSTDNGRNNFATVGFR